MGGARGKNKKAAATSEGAPPECTADAVRRIRQEISSQSTDNPLQQCMKHIRDVDARTRVRAFVSDVLITNATYGQDAVRMTRTHADLIGWEYWRQYDVEEETMRLIKKYIGLRRSRRDWSAEIENDIVQDLVLRSVQRYRYNSSDWPNFSLFASSSPTSPPADVAAAGSAILTRAYSPFGGATLWDSLSSLGVAHDTPRDDDRAEPSQGIQEGGVRVIIPNNEVGHVVLPSPRRSPVGEMRTITMDDKVAHATIPSPRNPEKNKNAIKHRLQCFMCGCTADTPAVWRVGTPCGHLVCAECCTHVTECPSCSGGEGSGGSRNRLIDINSQPNNI